MVFLFVAPNWLGYGETQLGLHVAAELKRAGHESTFVVPRRHDMLSLVGSQGYDYHSFLEGGGSLRKVIEEALLKVRPNCVVLADYMTTTVTLARDETKASLTSLCVPVVAIDTWDMARSGFSLDAIGRTLTHVPDWRDAVSLSVVPVPIAAPRDGVHCYSCLSGGVCLSRKVRRHVRRALGLGDAAKLILVCSARWQYARARDEAARPQEQLLPELLTDYLTSLGPDVHVIHVGPRKYRCGVPGYHWLPQLPAADFEYLFGSVDLLLTLNATASTVSRALSSDVPAVVLVNSHSIIGPEDLERLSYEMSPALRQVVARTMPLYPFYMWPVGFASFLGPVFADNPLPRAVEWTEVLDEQRVKERIRAALRGGSERDDMIARQRRYAERVRTLPGVAELIVNNIGSDNRWV